MSRIGAAAVAILLLAAGCTSDERRLSARLDEFRFVPDTWEVTSGSEESIALRNVGALVHTWVILDEGVEIEDEEEFDEDLVYDEVELASGASDTHTFTAPPEPGTYQVICTVESHFDQGMEGTLAVE